MALFHRERLKPTLSLSIPNSFTEAIETVIGKQPLSSTLCHSLLIVGCQSFEELQVVGMTILPQAA